MSKKIENLRKDIAIFNSERKEYLKEYNFWNKKFVQAKEKLDKILSNEKREKRCHA